MIVTHTKRNLISPVVKTRLTLANKSLKGNLSDALRVAMHSYCEYKVKSFTLFAQQQGLEVTKAYCLLHVPVYPQTPSLELVNTYAEWLGLPLAYFVHVARVLHANYPTYTSVTYNEDNSFILFRGVENV